MVDMSNIADVDATGGQLDANTAATSNVTKPASSRRSRRAILSTAIVSGVALSTLAVPGIASARTTVVRGATGPTGPTGPAGPRGATGVTGPTGSGEQLSGTSFAVSTTPIPAGESSKQVYVYCPPDHIAINGWTMLQPSDWRIDFSYNISGYTPNGDRLSNTWSLVMSGPQITVSGYAIEVRAICLPAVDAYYYAPPPA